MHLSVLDVDESVLLAVELHIVRTTALEAGVGELLILNVCHVLEALAALAVDERRAHTAKLRGAVAFRADVVIDG